MTDGDHSTPPVASWVAGGLLSLLTLTIPLASVTIDTYLGENTHQSINNKENIKKLSGLPSHHLGSGHVDHQENLI